MGDIAQEIHPEKVYFSTQSQRTYINQSAWIIRSLQLGLGASYVLVLSGCSLVYWIVLKVPFLSWMFGMRELSEGNLVGRKELLVHIVVQIASAALYCTINEHFVSALTVAVTYMEPFGQRTFSDTERTRIQALLARRLSSTQLATRPGPCGTKLTYVESCRAIELANAIFSYNGWSCSVKDLHVDYLDDKAGKWECSVTAIVQVRLLDGTYHEDVGCGAVSGAKTRAAALEKAKKEAVSDARKRALRLFGNGLGNCVYDKSYVKDVRRGRATPYRGDYNGPKLQETIHSGALRVRSSENSVKKSTKKPKTDEFDDFDFEDLDDFVVEWNMMEKKAENVKRTHPNQSTTGFLGAKTLDKKGNTRRSMDNR